MFSLTRDSWGLIFAYTLIYFPENKMDLSTLDYNHVGSNELKCLIMVQTEVQMTSLRF